MEMLHKHDVPATPVNTVPQVLQDAQTQARGIVQRVDHPRLGDIPIVSMPLTFAGERPPVRRAAPARGEHTDSVLAECGYSPAEVAALAGAEGCRMTRSCPVKVALAALLGLVLLCPAPAVVADLPWTDAAGVVHYTTNPDSIPGQHRDEVRIIDASRPPGEPHAAKRAAASTIPMRDGGPIMVTAHLNGVPLTLMLDTGADRTMLAPGALTRAGVDQGSGRRVRIIGVTGESEGREVTLARLDIAGAQLGPVAVVVHQVPAPEVDGLLGRDLLDAFTVTVDPVGGRAILIPR